MKLSHLILLACVSVCMTVVSCKDSAEESKSDTPTAVSPNATPTENPGVMQPTNAPGTIAVQPGGAAAQSSGGNTGGAQAHYTCNTEGYLWVTY